MDLASQTQRNVVKRAYGSTMNGSMQPYHLSLGSAFSNTPDRFPSMGMVVAGDQQRILSGIGQAPMAVNTGANYSGLSGPAQHVLRDHHVAKLGTGGISLMLVGGVVILLAGLDWPFARPIIEKAKQIIDQPKHVLQGIAIVTGTGMIVSGMGGA
jgi:hypothetical protein